MKKILLSMLGVFLSLPIFARDFTYTYERQTITYTVIDEEAKTCATKAGDKSTAGNIISGELVLPANPKFGNTEYTLTEIGYGSFRDNRYMPSVIIPPTVTSVSNAAFYNCTGLIKSAYPDNLSNPFSYGISIKYPRNAFFDEKGVIYSAKKDSIYFAPLSFEGEYSIPNSVTYIRDYAFFGSGLTSVKVPWAKPVSISNNVFNFEATLVIPENTLVTYLGSDNWNKFSNISVADIPTKFFSDGVLNYRLIENPDKREAVVVSGNYSSMTEVNIPERFTDDSDAAKPVRYYITGIANAFEGCTKLKTVNFHSRSVITAIGPKAFSGCKSLTGIKLPETVTSIGDYAFNECKALFDISIPGSVASIGNYAFYNCSMIKAEFASIEALCKIQFGGTNTSNPLNYAHHLYIDGEEITEVVIPETITKLRCTFAGASYLKSVAIPASVTEIGDYAFSDCDRLTSVVIPNLVTSIGNYAFYECKGLTSVTIGNSVQTIGDRAFSVCTGLTSVVIPNSVTTIGDRAFSNCSGLTSVVIGNSVQTIGNSAFFSCIGLTSVVIGKSVRTIGNSAFGNCRSLTSASIPNSVTSIGSQAYTGCSNLKSFSLLDSDAEVKFGTDVFKNVSLTDLYIGRPNSSSAFKGLNITTLSLGNTLTRVEPNEFAGYSSLKTLSLGSNITNIGASAFSGCTSLTEVVLPPAVDSIGASAFAGINSLATIVMGGNVKVIGEKAFDGASAKNVYITAQTPPTAPNNTFSSYTGKLWLQDTGDKKVLDAYYDAFTCWDRFDSYAMTVATSLEGNNKKITGKPGDTIQLSAKLMPENVSLPYIFWRSTNPEVATVDNKGLVTIHADNATLANDTRECKIIAESLYANSPALEFDVIPDLVYNGINYEIISKENKTCRTKRGFRSGINRVPGNNVSGDIILPEIVKINGENYTLVEIGDSSFFTNRKLTSISIPNSVTIIGASAFFNCSGLTSVVIPNSVQTMGEWAFSGCTGLTSVVIPNSVKTIGNRAFYNCTGLTSISISNSVQTIGEWAFYNCKGLTSVVIPNSVKTIGGMAFALCNSLKNFIVEENNPNFTVTVGVLFNKNRTEILIFPGGKTGTYAIPTSVTTIGNNAFYGCSGLTSVDIPNSVTSIGNSAFLECTMLDTINIPNSVVQIGDDAFLGCTPLKKVDFGSIESICSIKFSNKDSNPICYVQNLFVAGEKVSAVEIPDSIQSIGNYAFYGCNCIKSLTIHNSVTTIGDYAFYKSDSLTSVIFGKSISKIGDYAFFGCENIRKTIRPNTMKAIPYITNFGSQVYNPEGVIIEDGMVYGPEKKRNSFCPCFTFGRNHNFRFCYLDWRICFS